MEVINRGENQNVVLLKYTVRNEATREIESRFGFLTADEDGGGGGDSHFERLDHPRFGPHVMFHGHSHGIVCLAHGPFGAITLFNPVTGERRNLPPSLLLSPHLSIPGFDSTTDGIGFGYDPKSKDFKAVRVVGYYADYGVSVTPAAEVYELGKDRVGWRVIETPVPKGIDRLLSCEMYYQGFYYWWGTGLHDSDMILWFDLSEEVFGEISMPDACGYRSRALGVLNGSIVLLNVPVEGHEKSFDVWEMMAAKDDELGSSFSWTRLFTIGPVFGIDQPIQFVGSDRLLMADEEGQLILCNIFNTQHCVRLPVKGLSINSIEAAPFFVKTLLSLQGGVT